MSSISNIFGKKAVKSFAEQLAEVKNIFKTSYDQAIALNAAIAEDLRLNKMKQRQFRPKQTLILKLQKTIVSIQLSLKN